MQSIHLVGQVPFLLKAKAPGCSTQTPAAYHQACVWSVWRRNPGGHSAEDAGHPGYSENKA